MRLIPHHRNDGRREYRSPAGARRVVRTRANPVASGTTGYAGRSTNARGSHCHAVLRAPTGRAPGGREHDRRGRGGPNGSEARPEAEEKKP